MSALSSRGAPLIMVMQPTRFWNLPDRAYLRPLDRPRYRTIHVQCPMRTPVMIILEITSQKPPQMLLVQGEHVVEAFATDTPDEPFDAGILPGTSGRDQHLFDPHVPYSLPKVCPVDTITVVQEIPRCRVPRDKPRQNFRYAGGSHVQGVRLNHTIVAREERSALR
jgi:hypothetical protein